MPNVVVDQVLTTVVQGYVLGEAVGHRLFPVVPVTKAGGQVIEFTDRDFKLYQTQRARGANTKRVDIGYQGKPYALELHSLEGKVPREDLRDAEQASPSIKLGVRAVNKPMRAITLGLEVTQAQLARDPANYPATNKIAYSGTSQWSDPSSNPLGDFEAARETVLKQTGMYPNEVVFSPDAFKAFKNHPAVLKRLGTTADGKAITTQMIADLIEIENVSVGKMVYYDEAKDSTEYVWGNDVVIAYTPSDSDRDREVPAYGYTYRMEGHPFVEPNYYEANAKSWFYPVTDERKPVIAGVFAGYLMSNVA